MLQVRQLTITFPGATAPAVNDLSFELATGGRLGLLGLSGSGKSLTALALLGLLPQTATITSGEAWYTPSTGPAVDLLQLSDKAWRQFRGQDISLVFQEPLTALNPVHRIEKQLLEAVRHLCPQLTSQAQKKDHLQKWLTKVELGEDQERILRSFPHQLSGGQRQRLLIALALLGEPKFLIADEPTTALDTITEAGILRLLEQLRQELNMASLFITHDLEVMRRSADTLLVLSNGNTIRHGPTADLLALGEALFSLPSATPEATNAAISVRSTPTDDPILTVRDLTLSYATSKPWWKPAPPAKVAVQAVSFSLHAGEWLAIIGPSGCGKTSLARHLAGLQDKESGTVLLPVASSVQLIFQDPFSSLNPAHSLLQSIEEVRRVHHPDQSGKQRREAAQLLLTEVGLPHEEFADRQPAALSGGQRQRVAIARALAAQPTILIADESVSALDAPLRREILSLLDRLRRERKFGLLFISHDLELVVDWADQVLIMDAGKIVERGQPKRIFAQPQSTMGKNLTAGKWGRNGNN